VELFCCTKSGILPQIRAPAKAESLPQSLSSENRRVRGDNHADYAPTEPLSDKVACRQRRNGTPYLLLFIVCYEMRSGGYHFFMVFCGAIHWMNTNNMCVNPSMYTCR